MNVGFRLRAILQITLLTFLVIVSLNSAIHSAKKTPVTSAPSPNAVIALQKWLVAGPLPSPYVTKTTKKLSSQREGYSTDFLGNIGGEANAKIQPGSKILVGDSTEILFTPLNWEKSYIDLTDVFGDQKKVCAYLYAEIESKSDQQIFFHAGTNDAGKVWIGGKLVVENPSDGAAMRSQFIKKIQLKAGRTPVLVKIDQAGGGWGGYFELYGMKAHKKYLADLRSRDQAKDLDHEDGIATHIETKVICKQVNRYIGWPTIHKTRSGEFLAVFSGNRDFHICPWGVVQIIRSQDNGKTWSEALTINNTPLDDRDAGILETKSGTLLVNWFNSLAFDEPDFYEEFPHWKRHAEKIGPETRKYWFGNWTRRSLDGGKTWEAPVKQQVSAPHGPIELAEGRLLYVGTSTQNNEKVIGVEESRDDGKSWQFISTIPIPGNESIQDYHEPHVVELPDGKLISMIRYEPDDRSQCHLRQSESVDGGKTWTTAHKTPIWGFPPHLLLLNNGWLMVAYGVRRKPFSERACISRDGGKTWDIKNEIILSHAINNDLGYPASIQLDDGSILTIYYQIDKPGEKTCLMSTHWRLKEISGKK